MKKILLSIIFILILLLLNNSCRVDIIEPNNPAGNKNLPLKNDRENYFNVLINADALTTNMEFDTYFNSETNSLSLIISDRTSGNCTLRILSIDNKFLYTGTFEVISVNFTQRISRGIPAKVKLICDNFTAKVKITITKTSF
jgi:hypothetical protein